MNPGFTRDLVAARTADLMREAHLACLARAARGRRRSRRGRPPGDPLTRAADPLTRAADPRAVLVPQCQQL
jgi:hypothetical protein